MNTNKYFIERLFSIDEKKNLNAIKSINFVISFYLLAIIHLHPTSSSQTSGPLGLRTRILSAPKASPA